MFRHFCILCVAACSLWSAIIGLLVVACSGGGSGGGGGERDGTVKLFLGKLQIPMFDSISVDVSGDNMANIHISKSTLEDNLKIEGIPQGEYRRFEVKIFASGKLVQKGEADVNIKAGESITIPIKLEALFGFLRLEIPLGNSVVSSGKLLLDGIEYNMKMENGKGVFNTGVLPLNTELPLKIYLLGINNTDTLFIKETKITLSSISQSEAIQLTSSKGTANLEITISSDSIQMKAMLPESVYGEKRIPREYGEIFFTEIYASPATTEDDYFQYMELYNFSSDILQLSNNCKLVRMDNGTEHKITNLTILPMSYAIIGRNKVTNKDYSCGGFTLLKTTMRLGLFCGDSAIDTLTYSNKTFPVIKGTAMQLPLKNYENRTLGSSWCLGFSPRDDAICP